MKIEKLNVISDANWSRFVSETYGRPYWFSYQRWRDQGEKGLYRFTLPLEDIEEFDEHGECDVEDIPKPKWFGVKFEYWLERDPKKPLVGQTKDEQLEDWWENSFYPSHEVIANDLFNKGILEAGDYAIGVDW